MFQACALLALWATVIRVCIASPVPRPEVTLVERAIVQRSEAGPEIGGANFPGTATRTVTDERSKC